jgi:hypothetical protein
VTTTTVIDHLDVRWRPLAAGLSDPGRFERLSRALARGPLDAAIDVEAVDGAVVCVRAVEVPPVRVTADVTDDELLETLAATIAASVKTAASDARGQEAAVVRYRSVAHAALDVAVSLSRGDHSREWAWRQLGLWPIAGEPPAAGGYLATALAEAGGTLPGLLSAAAEAGALGSLAGLVGPAGLDGLVRAAWSSVGCTLPDWADMLGRGVYAPGDADFAEAMALLARGALGRMLLAGAELPPRSIAAASAAALLDGEPSLALGPIARVLRLVTAAALVSVGRSRQRAGGAGTQAGWRAAGGGNHAAAGQRAAGGNDAAAIQRAPGGNDAAAGQRAPAGTGPIWPPVAQGAPTADATLNSEDGAAVPGAGASASDAAASASAPVADVFVPAAGPPVYAERSGVATEFGGLPFLLHMVERCGLPERAAAGELADAGLVRVLYEVGTRILGRLLGPGAAPDPEDAALACLCGRAPIAGWRSGLYPGELPAAARQLTGGETERLIAALRAALEPSELAAAPENELLAAVCRRQGRVVAEPGWIDVQLDLVEVSTDVRRGGLDLDLGYLPWLGCVVRFVYG